MTSDAPLQWTCLTCGRKSTGQTCDYCVRQACRVCHKPIFRDESFHIDAQGWEHMRCMFTPRKRPKHMGGPRVCPSYYTRLEAIGNEANH